MSKLKVTTDVDNEIRMVRTFDAPRRLLIQAMTTPALIMRWLGGKRASVLSVDMDLRVGGAYRYRFRRPDGVEFSFSGVHREISDERIVYTQAMNDDPEAAVVTVTFAEHDGKTTMTLVIAFSSNVIRDAVVGTGMAVGAGESYDVLEGLLASL